MSPSAGFNFADIPNGLAAISKVPAAAAILAYGAFWDLAHDQSAGTRAAAGDDGFNILSSSDPADVNNNLSAKLANGRLAIMAIIGMFFQDGLTGSAWGDWAFYTAPPLRAFDNELGVHAPVGFCDPAGFTHDELAPLDDGNSDDFARLLHQLQQISCRNRNTPPQQRQPAAAADNRSRRLMTSGRSPTTASTATVIAAAAGQAATSRNESTDDLDNFTEEANQDHQNFLAFPDVAQLAVVSRQHASNRVEVVEAAVRRVLADVTPLQNYG